MDVVLFALEDSHGFDGSFNSDSRSYRSFDDDGKDDRPTADPKAICKRFDVPDRAAELQAIHRHRAVFKEDVCRDFCELIGAEPAMTTYDELERGTFEAPEGWQVERLLFVQRDAATARENLIDLHQLDLGGRSGDAPAPDRSAAIRIPPEVLAEMERRRRRTRFTVVLLRPLSRLARAWRQLIELPARWRRLERRRELPVGAARRQFESSAMIEVRHLINEQHRCRIRLAAGGEAKSGSSKPASVFAFQIGPTAVTCTARPRSRLEDVLQQPSRSKILRDEKYLVGGLKARHVVFELPPYYLAGTRGPSYLGLHVVQTDWALYVFLYRFPKEILTEVERAIRATVKSFRVT